MHSLSYLPPSYWNTFSFSPLNLGFSFKNTAYSSQLPEQHGNSLNATGRLIVVSTTQDNNLLFLHLFGQDTEESCMEMKLYFAQL